jgi:hypothetical protein
MEYPIIITFTVKWLGFIKQPVKITLSQNDIEWIEGILGGKYDLEQIMDIALAIARLIGIKKV